jgi:predicted NAD-dependent protein-ADP-ribosyltransferase YbiA (DUF1768 family)
VEKKQLIYTHIFSPFGQFKNIEFDVFLTGKTYEIGEHYEYKKYKVVEVQDINGNLHDAFEDELKIKNKIEYES